MDKHKLDQIEVKDYLIRIGKLLKKRLDVIEHVAATDVIDEKQIFEEDIDQPEIQEYIEQPDLHSQAVDIEMTQLHLEPVNDEAVNNDSIPLHTITI